MTQSMREKAIWAAGKAIHGIDCKACPPSSIEIGQATVAFDAAIGVLMEPSEAMIAASREYDDGRDCGTAILQAMLKAASQ